MQSVCRKGAVGPVRSRRNAAATSLMVRKSSPPSLRGEVLLEVRQDTGAVATECCCCSGESRGGLTVRSDPVAHE